MSDVFGGDDEMAEGLGLIVTDAMAQQETETEAMRREVPETSDARRALVTQWDSCLRYAREFHKPAFDRMRESMDFARGKQWPHMKSDENGSTGRWDDKAYYTANLVQRHVAQRVSSLYARNPKVGVRAKTRLMSSVWDGSPGQIAGASQAIQMAEQNGQPPHPAAVAIMQDFEATNKQRRDAQIVARTLELALDYFMGEQATSYKAQMKSAVRRAVTCGVAYIKVGFQREMQTRPDTEARINDASTRLAVLERLVAEIADGEADEYSAEAEQLRLTLEALNAESGIVKREGLIYDFPPAPSILVDPRCRNLRGFVGADWVGQEYLMTPDEVMEVYGIDVKQSGHAVYGGTDGYRAGQVAKIAAAVAEGDQKAANDEASFCLVTEIYSRKDGLVYHHCEGYPDFLREPSAPEFFLERFWPWVPLVFNECEHHTELFPPSDVDLIRDMQVEFNRSRQGLREHRRASRPKIVVPRGMLEDDDRETLTEHPDDGVAIVELTALQPGQKVEDVLQAFRAPGIDQNVYDTKQVFEDILRVVGSQEANMGPAGGDSTATESAIAESSRMSGLASSVDELDDVLSEVARASAQVLLSEVGEAQIKEIVGPGAVWPQLTQTQIAQEITVSIEAGSTGRPNKAVKINEFKSIMPFMLQTPGLRPDKVLTYMMRLLDDTLDVGEYMDPGLPSITAMNGMAGGAGGPPNTGSPENAPAAQGVGPGQGAQAPPVGAPPEQGPEGGSVPNMPAPEVHGMARRFLS